MLDELVANYRDTAPALATWLNNSVPEGPPDRLGPLLLNDQALPRLVSTVLVETDEI